MGVEGGAMKFTINGAKLVSIPYITLRPLYVNESAISSCD